MSLIPVNFCMANTTINKSYLGYTFEFTPSSRSIIATQESQLTDSIADRNNLNIRNLANDFKICHS